MPICVVFSGIMPFTQTVVFQFGRTIVWSSTLSIFSIFLQRRGGHGDEVVGRVGSPAGFVDLEFAPHIDHDEPQADVKQGVGAGFEACVSCTERPREELGDDESQHQEQGKGKDFSH